MRTGCPKRPLMLEAADQDNLELLARQPKIVLRATERLSNQEIARRLGVTSAGWEVERAVQSAEDEVCLMIRALGRARSRMPRYRRRP
jgi:hypothetical protein